MHVAYENLVCACNVTPCVYVHSTLHVLICERGGRIQGGSLDDTSSVCIFIEQRTRIKA
jgi:hypothetical protein